MQPLKLIRHVGDLIPLRVVVLDVMDRQVELIDEPTLPALDLSQIGIKVGVLARDILQVAFPCDARKVLVEDPAKTDQMLHEFAPGHTLVRMFHPGTKILFKFGETLFDAGLTVIEAHFHAVKLRNVSIHR